MANPTSDLENVLDAALSDRFTLQEEVGRGGMAVVYAAWDERHHRRVAVKVLHAQIETPESAQRFLAEIRTTAALSHPNLVPLIDSGQAGRHLYYIMPLSGAESLDARLEREGRLPVRDALRIAGDVAAGLAYAHRHGVIHRDVKPGNILVTPDGHATLSDFGVAHAVYRASTEPLTRPGFVVGTPAYMSPEQAAGQPIDARADVYALGLVLHEMLSGTPPVRGSPSAPLNSVRADVSRELSQVVSRATVSNPDGRFRTAGELEEALEAVSREYRPGEGGAGIAPAAWLRVREWGRAIGSSAGRKGQVLAAGLLVGLGLAVVVGVMLARGDAGFRDSGVVSFPLEPPPGVTLTAGGWNVPVISPDGKEVAFLGTDSSGLHRLWVRPLSRMEVTPLGVADPAILPFWSPDGEAIGYFTSTHLMAVPRDGDPVRRLAPTSNTPQGGTWSDRGQILFAPNRDEGLRLVSGEGGPITQVTKPDTARGETGHLWPDFLPGGERFLYFVASAVDSVRGIYLGSLAGTRGRRILAADASGVHAAGYMLYLERGRLVARKLDGDTVGPGPPTEVASGVASNFNFRGSFTASSRALAFLSAGSESSTQLVRVDSTGSVVETIGPIRTQRSPSLSPDGRFLALEVYEPPSSFIEIRDLHTGRTGRLAGREGRAGSPLWSPGGDRIAFAGERPGGWGIHIGEPGGDASVAAILEAPSFVMPTDWSPDGKTLMVARQKGGGEFDLVAVGVEGGRSPVAVVATPALETSARFSPSGDFVAYFSNESGRYQVHVQSFPSGDVKCQLSVDGGFDPAWAPDGSRIYFLSPAGTLRSVTLSDSGPCPGDRPRRLFDAGVHTPGGSRNNYVVLPDGSGFIVNRDARRSASPAIGVVVNWLAAVRASDTGS